MLMEQRNCVREVEITRYFFLFRCFDYIYHVEIQSLMV